VHSQPPIFIYLFIFNVLMVMIHAVGDRVNMEELFYGYFCFYMINDQIGLNILELAIRLIFVNNKVFVLLFWTGLYFL
jgi:hypothetical protein